MTVTTTIDAAGWLGKYLEGDDGDTDLARAMLQAFAETLMSAEASATCGAAYNERNEERTNSRNGYRRRPWHTRAGSIDLAVPKLREGSYFPDWLLTPRRRAEQALVASLLRAPLRLSLLDGRGKRVKQLNHRLNEVGHLFCLLGSDVAEQVGVRASVAVQPNMSGPVAQGAERSSIPHHLSDLVLQVALC